MILTINRPISWCSFLQMFNAYFFINLRPFIARSTTMVAPSNLFVFYNNCRHILLGNSELHIGLCTTELTRIKFSYNSGQNPEMQYRGAKAHKIEQNYILKFRLILRCGTSYRWNSTSYM